MKELPAALGKASDVRFASDQSLFLALNDDGTVEVPLASPGDLASEVIPGRRKLGFSSHHLAASADHLAVAGPAHAVTWRTRTAPERKEAAFDIMPGIDLQGDRLLVLGARRDGAGEFAPEGALAWIGSLGSDLEDLNPVHFDFGGAQVPALNNCAGIEIGGARFAPDGSYWIAPGVQGGVYHYAADGRLLRTWNTEELGIEVDCRRRSWKEFSTNFPNRIVWLNERQVVDALLPSPTGPALIIRRFDGERPRWDLVILQKDQPPQRVPLDLPSINESTQVEADIRGDRIVVLLHAIENYHDLRRISYSAPLLALLEIRGDALNPQGKETP